MGQSKKITTLTVAYPQGFEPDYIVPKTYNQEFRFVLAKKGVNPLCVIAMNPSAARDTTSDRTVNKIIRTGQSLKDDKNMEYDGYAVFNLYPERATDATKMNKFNKKLHEANLTEIKKFITQNGVREIWGAWGNVAHQNFKLAKPDLIKLLKSLNIRVFCFKTTKSGEPYHPLYLRISNEKKIYLKF